MKINDVEWWRHECLTDPFFFSTVVLSTAFGDKFHDFGKLQHNMFDFLNPYKTPGPKKCLSVDRHSYKTTVLLGFFMWLFVWHLYKKRPLLMAYNTATQQ